MLSCTFVDTVHETCRLTILTRINRNLLNLLTCCLKNENSLRATISLLNAPDAWCKLNPLKTSGTPLKLLEPLWNTLGCPWSPRTPWNAFEIICIALEISESLSSFETPGTALKRYWNFLERHCKPLELPWSLWTILKSTRTPLKPLKTPWNALETPWNTLKLQENPCNLSNGMHLKLDLKRPWKLRETSWNHLEYPWN